jgi:hypothetical protein
MNNGQNFWLPVDFAARHARLFADFLANEKPTKLTRPDMFSKSGILPLTGDWGGCTGIRADGEIVFFLWDNPDDVQVETDPRLRNLAIFQGAKRFPELAMLIPPRPADAVTCGHCDGSGVMPEFPEIENIVCYCGGLGWLPPDTPPTA